MKWNKKRAMLFSFAALASLSVIAQESAEEYSKKVKPQFVVNKFWDNWYIGANGGFQVYRGEGDPEAKFGDRMTPAIDFSVGKWVTPAFGVRGVIGGFKLKTVMQDDYSQFDEWNYYNLHMDLMFNIANAVKYNPKRIYEPIIFAGFGFVDGKEKKVALMNHFGLINKFRVSKLIDLNLEASVSMVTEHWDGKTGHRELDGLFAVTGGIAFKFPKRDFIVYDPTCPVEVNRLNGKVNELHESLASASSKNAQLEKDLIEARNKKPEVIEVVKQIADNDADYAPAAIIFHLNSSAILKDQILAISNMAEVIKAHPDKVYKVVGFADKATGTAEYNQKLSERRAEAVAKMLVDRFGVNASQLTTSGKGSSEQLYGENNWNRVAIISE